MLSETLIAVAMPITLGGVFGYIVGRYYANHLRQKKMEEINHLFDRVNYHLNTFERKMEEHHQAMIEAMQTWYKAYNSAAQATTDRLIEAAELYNRKIRGLNHVSNSKFTNKQEDKKNV